MQEYNEILKLHRFRKNILAKAASPVHNSNHDLKVVAINVHGN